MATSYETDRAIALALDQRRQSEADVQAQQLFDESLARTLQDDEITHIERGRSRLPALDIGLHLAKVERRVSERLAEAGDFIRHIPRTVTADEAHFSGLSSDRVRLQQRLEEHGLCERTVTGDGNCQFRALSNQLYRSPGYYSELRHAAVEQLRNHPDIYAPYVEGSFEEYRRDMDRDGTWGDHITLQAIADVLGVRIYIITSYEHSGVIEICPNAPTKTERFLYLSFWAEVHYNSVLPVVEEPLVIPHQHRTLGSRHLYKLLH